MNNTANQQNKRIIILASIVILIATFAMFLQFKVLYDVGIANSGQVLVMAGTVIMQMSALLIIVLNKTRDHLETVTNLAYYDELTGLMNRRKFNEILSQKLSYSRENNTKFGLLILDLDRFKAINDCHGHDAGDKVICQFGGKIKKCIGKKAITSRLSGDEFAVIIDDVQQEQDITSVCDAINEEMKQPFIYEGKKISTTASIGAAIVNGTEDQDLSALRMADFALLDAKENGRNRAMIFNQDMAERIKRLHHLEAGLQKAISGNVLKLKYQPFILQKGSSISGVEALTRWHDPVLGEIYPSEFIPIAKDLGILEELGEFILQSACNEIKPLGNLTLAVNISTTQFSHDGFVEQIKRVLEKTGFESSRLELELGQNLLVSQSTKIKSDLQALRDLGVRIALDDFGTSYSNMFFLRDFKLDRIKLDRNFVHNMQNEKDGDSIIENMISLGSTFSDKLTVEGVETEEQLKTLQQSGVNDLQGYLFSKPLTLSELLDSKMLETTNMPHNDKDITINRMAG